MDETGRLKWVLIYSDRFNFVNDSEIKWPEKAIERVFPKLGTTSLSYQVQGRLKTQALIEIIEDIPR